MADYSSDRRSLLKIFGSVGATCAYPFASDELYGQTSEPSQHQHPIPQARTTFFADNDLAMIARVADLIIPETDTPGAVAAGVPAYIDLVVGRNSDQQLVVADGLRWLDAEANRLAQKKFLVLTEAQQLSILEPLCAGADEGDPAAKGRNIQFFALIKSLTADGYYTSRTGLLEELKYSGNAARPAYPACAGS